MLVRLFSVALGTAIDVPSRFDASPVIVQRAPDATPTANVTAVNGFPPVTSAVDVSQSLVMDLSFSKIAKNITIPKDLVARGAYPMARGVLRAIADHFAAPRADRFHSWGADPGRIISPAPKVKSP